MVNKSGVYKITNLVNNKIYIGSSVNIKTRWNEHRNDLQKLKHGNVYLQRSFNKYGLSNLKFEIVEHCERTDCIDREQYYIDSLKPQYNLCKIAGSSYRNPTIVKSVILYNLDGKCIKKFDSIIDCAEYLGVDVSTVSTCAKGEKNVTVKNHFVLYGKKSNSEEIAKRLEKIKISKFNKTKHSRSQSIQIEQYSLNGEIINTFNSLTDATKYIKATRVTILNACNHNLIYKGCIWKHKNKL